METVTKQDISTENDIIKLVHNFYARVRKDELLGPIFEEVIKDNWDKHLETMCNFWSTMLLYSRKYHGDPLTKHLPLPIASYHFEKWLVLFKQTVDELFEGRIAENAIQRASNIARIMNAVIERQEV